MCIYSKHSSECPTILKLNIEGTSFGLFIYIYHHIWSCSKRFGLLSGFLWVAFTSTSDEKRNVVKKIYSDCKSKASLMWNIYRCVCVCVSDRTANILACRIHTNIQLCKLLSEHFIQPCISFSYIPVKKKSVCVYVFFLTVELRVFLVFLFVCLFKDWAFLFWGILLCKDANPLAVIQSILGR